MSVLRAPLLELREVLVDRDGIPFGLFGFEPDLEERDGTDRLW